MREKLYTFNEIATDVKSVKRTLKESENEQCELEEMKRLHPLVTDERFFRTSYFPDITPNCFKE